MSDYCTLYEVKSYIPNFASTDTDNDDEILRLITSASRMVDTYCGRFFNGTVQDRYYDAIQDVDGQQLFLDEDCLGVSSIVNGDGQTLPSTSYVLLPPNDTPKYAVYLKSSQGKVWTFVTDSINAITVTGTWGFSSTTPDAIKQATIRCTAWLWSQRKAPFETTGFPELGMVSTPIAMPNDIKTILDNGYVKIKTFGIGRRGRFG